MVSTTTTTMALQKPLGDVMGTAPLHFYWSKDPQSTFKENEILKIWAAEL